MKKFFLLAVAAVALPGLASCSKGDCKSNCDAPKDDMTYTGVVPAADGPGVRYTLTVDYDHDGLKGDYDLVETYLEADTTSVNGIKDNVSFKSEGDFTVTEKDGKKYLKLVKDAKDSNANASDALFFEVGADNATLTMVNSDLEAAVMPELYTLTLVK